MPSGIAAIIAAAGLGERAGSAGEPVKQFRDLGGRPVIEWSAELFRKVGCDPIVLVVPATHVAELQKQMSPGSIVTSGGSTRQESVALGLDQIDSEHVLVHDGARPLATEALVHRVIAGLSDHDAVVPGLPVSETLKISDGRTVTGTVDRDSMWAIQTPQGFRTSVLRTAHERAADEGALTTDDAGLIERYGGKVALVPGQRTNIKITHAEDFDLALLIVKGTA